MANLFTGSIDTKGQYKTLAELTGLTFTSGNKYSIQIQNMAYLREGTVGGGFLINKTDPITYTASSDNLYLKTDYQPCVVNVAE